MAAVQHMARRAVLKGALALTAVPIGASAAGVPIFDAVAEPAVTPIRAIFRRYNAALQRHHEIMRGIPAGNWVAASKLTPERQIMEEAREEIREEPITSLEDLALKVMVVTGYLRSEEWQLSHECLDFLSGEV